MTTVDIASWTFTDSREKNIRVGYVLIRLVRVDEPSRAYNYKCFKSEFAVPVRSDYFFFLSESDMIY